MLPKPRFLVVIETIIVQSKGLVVEASLNIYNQIDFVKYIQDNGIVFKETKFYKDTKDKSRNIKHRI